MVAMVTVPLRNWILSICKDKIQVGSVSVCQVVTCSDVDKKMLGSLIMKSKSQPSLPFAEFEGKGVSMLDWLHQQS